MKRRVSIYSAAFLVSLTINFGSLATNAFSQSTQGNLPQSKLGVKGSIGFVISAIDPGSPLESAGLRSGDIITVLDEQVNSIEQFQSHIAKSAPGTSIEISYLRFNPATGKLDEKTTSVKTIPFISQTPLTTRNISMTTQEFPISPNQECPGCCANCNRVFEPGYQACILSTEFTGKSSCRIVNGRCVFVYCAY